MTDALAAGPVAVPAASAAPVIAARHLTKTYQLGEHAVHALRDVSFDIQRGEFVAIMGPQARPSETKDRQPAAARGHVGQASSLTSIPLRFSTADSTGRLVGRAHEALGVGAAVGDHVDAGRGRHGASWWW